MTDQLGRSTPDNENESYTQLEDTHPGVLADGVDALGTLTASKSMDMVSDENAKAGLVESSEIGPRASGGTNSSPAAEEGRGRRSDGPRIGKRENSVGEEEDDEDETDEEDEEEDEEPRLKYARLTQNLNAVYRNGDATSAFIVGGDKMVRFNCMTSHVKTLSDANSPQVVGTHNGNIVSRHKDMGRRNVLANVYQQHVIQLPIMQPLRVYHAHSASVTSISISPYPPPLSNERPDKSLRQASQTQSAPRPSDASPAASNRRPKEPMQVPRTTSNDIYVATSSMDGNVCVQSLLDVKDVQLRNFGRPVQAVALSPDYKTDRTYLSGGLAGQLILTVGGGPGKSTSTTIGTAAATASGWLGSMGLGTNTGKDTILHSGEGTVNCIKWSLSGKYVAWLNEYGIKFMRTKHQLESVDLEGAWQRIGHYDRPQTEEWEAMASVWKGRVEWIDERAVEDDDTRLPTHSGLDVSTSTKRQTVERLLVGWGGTIWIIHIHGDGSSSGKPGQSKPFRRAEVAKM